MKIEYWISAAVSILLILAGCSDPVALQDPNRFQVNQQGVIVDRHSGLQWAPDPGAGMTWGEAEAYARQLRLGGFTDWRLPTRAELKRLGAGGLDPVFKLAGNVAWSSERADDSSAWEFHFREGRAYWLFINRHAQALAVRSPR